MSYLLDKKTKRKKLVKYAPFAVLLFILIYFRTGIYSGLSYGSYILLRPFIAFGGNVRGKIGGAFSFFHGISL